VLRVDDLGASKRGYGETLFSPKQGIILDRSVGESSMHLALERQATQKDIRWKQSAMTDEWLAVVS